MTIGRPHWMRALLVVALAVGVIGMHGLSAVDAIAVQQRAVMHHQAPDSGCDHDGQGHAHPGPMCESAAVPTSPTFGLSLAEISPAPLTLRAISPATTAESATKGSGRGPPSLDELSISRT